MDELANITSMIEPDRTYATGQTSDDLVQLSQLFVNWAGDDAQKLDAALPSSITSPEYIPSDRGSGLIIANVLPLCIALVVVLVDTYARVRRSRSHYTKRRKLVFVDYLAWLAWVFSAVIAGASTYGALNLKWGYDFGNMTVVSLDVTDKLIFALTLLLPVVTTAVLTGITIILRRIFVDRASKISYVCNAVMAFPLILLVATIVGYLFAGSHMAKWTNWGNDVQTYMNVVLGANVAFAVIELINLIVAIKAVCGAKGKTKKSLSWALLLLGILAFVINCVGIVELFFHFRKPETTHLINAIVCIYITNILGIICTCCPQIYRLFSSSSAHSSKRNSSVRRSSSAPPKRRSMDINIVRASDDSIIKEAPPQTIHDLMIQVPRNLSISDGPGSTNTRPASMPLSPLHISSPPLSPTAASPVSPLNLRTPTDWQPGTLQLPDNGRRVIGSISHQGGLNVPYTTDVEDKLQRARSWSVSQQAVRKASIQATRIPILPEERTLDENDEFADGYSYISFAPGHRPSMAAMGGMNGMGDYNGLNGLHR